MGKNRDHSKFPNAITVLDNGNVGIGISNPSFAAGTGLAISDASRSNLMLTDGTNIYNIFQTGVDAYADLRTTGNIVWRTTSGNIERMRLTNSGNLGIGVSNPIAKLNVNGIAQFGATTLQTSGTDYVFVGQNSAAGPDDGTSMGLIVSYAAASGSPMIKFTYQFRLNDNSGANLYGDAVRVTKESGSNSTYTTFHTNATIGAGIERVRINSAGHIGIGTSSPSYRFHVVGAGNGSGWSSLIENDSKISVYSGHAQGYGIAVDSASNNSSVYLLKLASGDGTNRGTSVQFQVFANGNATLGGTFTENSSIRYKDNIQTIKYGLDSILALRGVTYTKKETGINEIGLIAEEVESILPDVVIKDAEGQPDSVAYARIVAVLIEAIKDLKQEINEINGKLKV